MEDRCDNRISLCMRLLENCRNELMVAYPHLDAAFGYFASVAVPGGETIASDAAALYFSPQWLVEVFAASPTKLRRGYLHMLMHWLFLHPFGEYRRDPVLDLACDMAVEQLLHREKNPRLILPEEPVREQCLSLLGEQARSAEAITQMIRSHVFPFTLAEMTTAFSFDDHSLWSHCAGDDALRKQWISIGSGAENKRRAGRPGTVAGDVCDMLDEIKLCQNDYRSWLRQFTVIREEMELDTDHFDPIFYHFGMAYYGNMPLIEPLECKEVARLEELVIAIDTSGSCDRETVQRFLEDTFAILSSRENFFRKMNVYLIQCDCMVQDVQILRSAEDWQRCSRSIVIQGRGGTDFTPVFNYVDKLRRERELKNLKALLYFTDGEGFYPREKPEYETAFIFAGESEYIQHAPSWAKKLMLGGRRLTIT